MTRRPVSRWKQMQSCPVIFFVLTAGNSSLMPSPGDAPARSIRNRLVKIVRSIAINGRAVPRFAKSCASQAGILSCAAVWISFGTIFFRPLTRVKAKALTLSYPQLTTQLKPRKEISDDSRNCPY